MRILAFCTAASALSGSASMAASAPPVTTKSTAPVVSKTADVYVTFDALSARGEALEIKGLAEDESNLVVSWNGFEPVFSSNGERLEDLVVTHVPFGGMHDPGTHGNPGGHSDPGVAQIVVERLPSLGGSFRAVFSAGVDGNLVAQISSLIETNGVRIVINVADGTIVSAATCVCFGATAGGTACTATQCDESEACLSDAGGVALKHCRNTALDVRYISASIIQFR